jgi:hypothetical protein
MALPLDLTRHHALPRRYLGRDILSGREGRGYTASDLFKFYGLITSLLFALALTYIKYLDLFAEATKPGAERGWQIAGLLTTIPLLMGWAALEGFIWWASLALVDYTRWQRVEPVFWRWFWVVVLNFYLFIVMDPLDKVHRLMSRNGLLPAPNLIMLFSGKAETFQFQWGYFLLWALFWFLVVITHLSYFADGLRELWFYVKRINRYSASVLTGFRGTALTSLAPPVTLRTLAPPKVQAPRLLGQLNQQSAEAVVAADASHAITVAPGQSSVLLVDLAAFYWTPQLGALKDAQGNTLLTLEELELDPVATRSELVVPLGAPTRGITPGPEPGGQAPALPEAEA